MITLILRHRAIVLTSPVWMAAILVALKVFGSAEIRHTVEFITFR